MKNNHTHISIVLDRSQSMFSIAPSVIAGFNRFIEEQKAVPGDCDVTLVQFDSEGIDTCYHGKSVQDVPPLTTETYVPRAWTPLYDAIGQTIDETGGYLTHLPEAVRPAKVVFMVMTDGLENSSKRFSQDRVQQMVGHQRDVYKWEFVFLGANINSYAVGGGLMIPTDNTMNYAANNAGVTELYRSSSANLRSFRTGQAASMAFSEADREKQEKAGAKQQ